jgi:hypothetical protein
VAVLVLLLASVGLVLAGLVCQVVFKDTDGTRDYQQVYPWLYFLAAWAPLALALRWLCWRLYTVRGPAGQMHYLGVMSSSSLCACVQAGVLT